MPPADSAGALTSRRPLPSDDEHNRPAGGGDRAAALLRGTLMHRLLQSLPDIPAARRAKAAEKYMARAAADLTRTIARCSRRPSAVAARAPRFAALFAPRQPRRSADRRLGHAGGKTCACPARSTASRSREDEIFIADFKTNRPPPRESPVRRPTSTQLALYRAVLQKLYPDRASCAPPWSGRKSLI